MKAPVSWIRTYVDLPAEVTTEDLAARLTALGLKLEAIERPGDEITGPLVVARVLSVSPEPQKNGKTINWCAVDVGAANGTGEPQGIVCGAHNFGVGDLVVVVLPGGVLPGGFEISARTTYGHLSAGMICSAAELGLPETFGGGADGIIVLPPGTAEPGTDAFDLLGLAEEVIEFEINPDRAYALSLRGIAREAALAYDAPFSDPAVRDVPSAQGPAQGVAYPVEVTDAAGCPVFVTRTVSGFDPAAPTPDWMQRRLQLAGMRPISLAVDVSNYVMLELGQPNHCYDADRLSGPIVVRRAQPGERLTTLDGVARALDAADLLIADDSGPIGIAGVMGGASTEITETTSRIVVEAAHFDPVTVFRTQKRHKLGSEASKRFERGVDPLLPLFAADRVVQLLVELGGARPDDGTTYVGAPPSPATVEMDAALPARVTGMPIDASTTAAHLEAVGCVVSELGDNRLSAIAPSWRPDLTDPFDLVEEVARIVGYADVPSILATPPVGAGLTRTQRLRRRVGRLLAGSGLVEVVSFPFTGEAMLDTLEIAADDPRRNAVRLANPISANEPLFTTTLLTGTLGAATRNTGRGAPGIEIFETGPVAFATSVAAPLLGVDRRPTQVELDAVLAAVPHQPQHLSLVLGGVLEPAGWWGPARTAAWSDLLGIVRTLADDLGVPITLSADATPPWHPGRCARVSAVTPDGEVVLGHAGELHPRVVAALDLPARTSAAELDLDLLFAAAPTTVRAPDFSTYPVAKEDVALVVENSVPAGEVEAALREGAGELLESLRLFDVYTGAGVEEGTKSLAFALRFRARDRTLAEGEAVAARDAAVAFATERTGARLRG